MNQHSARLFRHRSTAVRDKAATLAAETPTGNLRASVPDMWRRVTHQPTLWEDRERLQALFEDDISSLGRLVEVDLASWSELKE